MPPQSDRSVLAVLADISHNVERLARAHVRLEAAVVLESGAAMAWGVGVVAVGGLLGGVATLLLLLSAVARLVDWMSPWEALLLVAVGTALLSTVIIVAGLRALRRPPLVALFDAAGLEREPWPQQPLT